MLNLLLRLSRCGWVVTKMKLSKLSGTLVEISWLVAVLRTECVCGSQSNQNLTLSSKTSNAEFTKFNGVVQASATLCLLQVGKMVS